MTTGKYEIAGVFDEKRATGHDVRLSKLRPLREALHLVIRFILSDLPVNARILCVGAGTGPELIYLAQTFPNWQFTAVEPSVPMLDICRRKVESHGLAARCQFHAGYLDSLAESEGFDAATSILVSQFIASVEDRRDFFRQIAGRLNSGGLLVNADLSSDILSLDYNSLLEVWKKMMSYADIPSEDVENLGHKIAVLPQMEINSIIESAGFNSPTLFFQSLLIHAWFCKTTS